MRSRNISTSSGLLLGAGVIFVGFGLTYLLVRGGRY